MRACFYDLSEALLKQRPLLHALEYSTREWRLLLNRKSVWCRFLTNLGPGMGELNNRLVQKGVPPQLQKVEEIEAIVQQATQTGGRPAWAMDDWLS